MTYKQTLDYLFSNLPMFQRIGAAAYKDNLDISLAMDDILRHPHLNYRTIHIAGTNGKGSVSNMIAAILQAQGYKTGLFTSPHLKDFRERIRVNGRMIPRAYITGFVEQYKPVFDEIKHSFFEWTVALAFDYFRSKKVDIAVIETGLGGRLDSTNIITPVLSVITNIGWDHANLLGNTLEKIAAEKAGIIKKNVPVLIGESQKVTNGVFKNVASEKSSPLFFADQLVHLNIVHHNQNEIIAHAELIREKRNMHALKLKLKGDYQLKNLATVVAATTLLNKQHISLSGTAIKKGINQVQKLTGFKGRWQILTKKPLIIADTGHNVDGMKYVVRQICKTPHQNLHFVLGMVADKDISAILKLLPGHAQYYFCNAKIPRALSSNELKDKALAFGLKGQAFSSVKRALNAAKRNAAKNDLIFIGGSTFTVAEII